MRQILNENDLVTNRLIENTIKQNDIRTHTQLKAELKKQGLDMKIEKDSSGKVKSYTITEKNPNTGGVKLHWDSKIGTDRNLLSNYDKLMEKNVQKAQERAKPQEKNNFYSPLKELRELRSERLKQKKPGQIEY